MVNHAVTNPICCIACNAHPFRVLGYILCSRYRPIKIAYRAPKVKTPAPKRTGAKETSICWNPKIPAVTLGRHAFQAEAKVPQALRS